MTPELTDDLARALDLIAAGQTSIEQVLGVIANCDQLRELDAAGLIRVQRWFCPLFEHEMQADRTNLFRVPDGPPFSPTSPAHSMTPSWRTICDSASSSGRDQFRVSATELGRAALARWRREAAMRNGFEGAETPAKRTDEPNAAPLQDRLRRMAEGAVLGPGGGPLSPLQRAIILCLLDRRGGLSVKALVEFCKKAGEARNSKTIRNNLASLKARGIPIENSPKVGYYLALEDEPPTTP